MTSQEFERKLTAILSADVVGYSRLMEEDENSTIRTLTGHREMMSTLIKQRKGRVIDSPGDNLLAAFSSVTQAVECAVEIQREMAERNAELPEERKMEYRIGVNLGDVIEEGERIYGDGVNIAARLESLAEPGGICISGFVYNQIKNRLKLEYEFMGEQTVKNIKEPVPVYRVLSVPGAAAHRVIKAKNTVERSWRNRIMIAAAALIVIVVALSVWYFYFHGTEFEPASVDRMAYPLPDKPSIAVLPFTNMSGDPSQEYIGDGFSENITAALSKIGNLFVIARNSTFIYKGKPVKVQQVAEELGVRYVLEGSIQKSDDRLRVTAQLIDALNGNHLWANKYDRKMEDLFDLQDEITKKIVVSLQGKLMRGEEALIEAKHTNNLEAWGKVAEAYNIIIFGLNEPTQEDLERARKLLEDAINLDPNYATAWAMLGWSYMTEVMFGLSDSPFNSFKHANEAGQKALAIDNEHPYVFLMQGLISLFQRRYDEALAKAKKAITIDPNYYGGHFGLAVILINVGRFEEALEHIQKAIRLCPYYPHFFLEILGDSYFYLGRYDEAIATYNQLYDRNRKEGSTDWRAQLGLAQVYAALGREGKARLYMTEALKANPKLSIQFIEFTRPTKNPDQLQRILDIYHKAGMPEKSPRSVQ